VNGIRVLGLNHKTAPLELRERCRAAETAEAWDELRDLAAEAVVLSTCNRFEVYTHEAPEPDAILGWIARRSGVGDEEVRAHCFRLEGRNACKHLFFVASSLDSLVVGETQIRHQVKEAYSRARARGGVGPVLNQLFQTALRVSKEIAETTAVGRGSVSVAGAAAELAERVFGDLRGAAALVVGAGDTAELVLTHLAGRGVGAVRVLNRTPERAAELAARFGGTGAGLDALDDALAEGDILVGAAGGESPLIPAAAVRRALRRRRGRPMVVVDIALPRCVDPAVDALDNVYRYDMDALAEVTRDALRHRRREFLQCCTLVDAATLRLVASRRANRAGPLIAEMERAYRETAAEELEALERRLPGLGEAEREHLRRSFHRLLKRILHVPLRAIRSGDEESEAVRRAFGPSGEEDEP
jgi:glutamyl-tRNA reductase